MRQNVRRKKKASRFVLPITTRIIESALKLNGNLTAALRGVHVVRASFFLTQLYKSAVSSLKLMKQFSCCDWTYHVKKICSALVVHFLS